MEISASNSNAVVNYNGMDAHKKALFGHNSSDLDSGFAENFSMSHATGSTSGLSSSAKYTSMSSKRSLDLETISENNEQKGEIRLFINKYYSAAFLILNLLLATLSLTFTQSMF